MTDVHNVTASLYDSKKKQYHIRKGVFLSRTTVHIHIYLQNLFTVACYSRFLLSLDIFKASL